MAALKTECKFILTSDQTTHRPKEKSPDEFIPNRLYQFKMNKTMKNPTDCKVWVVINFLNATNTHHPPNIYILPEVRKKRMSLL